MLGYSIPIKKKITKKELFKNLYFLKKQPNAIPYEISYYKKRWGFCISYNQYKKFNRIYSSNDKFKIIIDSSLNYDGKLNYGELILRGKSKEEILISTYVCHPSMANDNLSGVIVSMALIDYFKKVRKNFKIYFYSRNNRLYSLFE